jgi:hypothetical protein
MITLFFTRMKFLVLDVLPREEKFNQNHFRASTVPELPKVTQIPSAELTKKKRSCTWIALYVIMGARPKSIWPEKDDENPHPVYSRDL